MGEGRSTGPNPRQTLPLTSEIQEAACLGPAAQPWRREHVDLQETKQQCPCLGLRERDASISARLVSGGPAPRRALEGLQHLLAWRPWTAVAPWSGSTAAPRARSAARGGDTMAARARAAAAGRRGCLRAGGVGGGPDTGGAGAEGPPREPSPALAEWGLADSVTGAESHPRCPGRQGPGNVPGEGETAARGGARSPPPPAGFVLPPRAAAGTGPPDFPAAGVGRICGVSDPLASADPSWLHPWRGPQAPLAGTTQLPPCPQALLFKEF